MSEKRIAVIECAKCVDTDGDCYELAIIIKECTTDHIVNTISVVIYTDHLIQSTVDALHNLADQLEVLV